MNSSQGHRVLLLGEMLWALRVQVALRPVWREVLGPVGGSWEMEEGIVVSPGDRIPR